ncbi:MULTISPECIES: hypothetical protein [Enterococcus]|uniref:hypothetical protein n=1 Tax=Enterococcus TaxID=1350 RepID=UPI0021DF486C|nr:hypothetical protein [Enterococcus faecalis]EME3503926.1 hypothetical protein [Enterococcus faecium]EME7094178.1 hypothetical protein [Enterococcus faecium]EME8193853.1 hypothetical protein [Enterococcus faecium]EME8275086.1 hypothetical protein [Enterococcus faecium]EMF0280690.1 hypothetical protein [Enterococcus faecium]
MMKKIEISKEELKKEAIKRMECLDLSRKVILQFQKKNEVRICPHYFFGKSMPVNSEIQEVIHQFEKRTGGLVYYVLATPYVDLNNEKNIMTMYSLFYVSKYSEEWEADILDMSENYQITYVYNANYPELSELGTIAFNKINGGLQRLG